MTISFEAELWQYEGPAAWHFVTLPAELGGELRLAAPRGLKGFGSIGVTAQCQAVTWKTSVFPDTKRGSYVLPVKADVRRQLGAAAGDRLEITLVLEI